MREVKRFAMVLVLLVACAPSTDVATPASTTASSHPDWVKVAPRISPRASRAGRATVRRARPSLRAATRPAPGSRTCKASFYHDRYEGRTTASGSTFHQADFTVATRSRDIPFGTVLAVRRLGREIRVEVTDRMGAHDPSDRCLDLSQAAFKALAPLSRGVITVKWRKV